MYDLHFSAGSLDDILSELRHLSLEMNLPEVRVGHFNTRGEKFIKLRSSYAGFYRAVCLQLKTTSSDAKLYVYDESHANRFKLTEDSYPGYLRNCINGTAKTTVFVYQKVDPADANSPEHLLADTVERDGVAAPPVRGGTRTSGRSSNQQEAFRNGVIRRDGTDMCVVCGLVEITTEVEAAHVLELQSVTIEELDKCKLADANDVRNGIMLCTTCHGFFDAYLWYVDDDNKIVVADALLQCTDTRVRSFWLDRSQKFIRKPESDLYLGFWPVPATWKFRERMFNAARTARHAAADLAEAAGKLKCPRCGNFLKAANLAKHMVKNKKCAAAGGRNVFQTPIRPREATLVERSEDSEESGTGDDAEAQ